MIVAQIVVAAALHLVDNTPSLQTSPPAQQPCLLRQFASLPMTTPPNSTVSIPVSLNGHPVDMEVDTGSVASSVSMERAEEFGLKAKLGRITLFFMNNVPMPFYTKLDTVQLGQATAANVILYLTPPRILSPDVSGLFGPDFMSGYDVEFDFAAGTFKLFLPNSCPQAPVYWTHDAYAELPMTVARDDHISVPAQLDGVPINVIVDTGSPRSTMNLDQARELFAWGADDPKLVQEKPRQVNGGAAVAIYRYPFRTISFEGIQVSNPDIDIIPRKNFVPGPTLVLGMSVLRQMHLYIGYQARKLYVTAAEAR